MSESVLKGLIKTVSASYVRPGDTILYSIGDAVSNSTTTPLALTFSNTSRVNGGSGYIVNAYCSTSQTAFSGALRLFLFKGNVAPIATSDNAQHPLLATNNVNRIIGYIDFQSFITGGSGSDIAISVGAFQQGRLMGFDTNLANSDLYGLVLVTAAFTPTSGQNFSFYLGIDQG